MSKHSGSLKVVGYKNIPNLNRFYRLIEKVSLFFYKKKDIESGEIQHSTLSRRKVVVLPGENNNTQLAHSSGFIVPLYIVP